MIESPSMIQKTAVSIYPWFQAFDYKDLRIFKVKLCNGVVNVNNNLKRISNWINNRLIS